MHKDARGLDVTAASAAAVKALDAAIDGYLSYRSDIAVRMETLFAADPECALAHCLKGYLALLSYKQSMLPVARAASADTWRLVVNGTPREHAHAAALDAWVAGDPDRAAEIWEQILRDHPHDILAFR